MRTGDRCGVNMARVVVKRQLIHVDKFNVGLILRELLGAGTPRSGRNASADLL